MEKLRAIKLNFKKIDGQSLIEVLVALSASVVIISAIVISVSNALSNVQFSKNQNMASNYAQQGIEITRKSRDSDLTTFLGYTDGVYCLDENSISLPSKTNSNDCESISSPSCTTPNVGGIFIREICLKKNSTKCQTPDSLNTIEVFSDVYWSDSKCTSNGNSYCHKTELISCLSDFNLVPTP